MRIALTGAATGIGAEVAAKLKQEGHHITAFDVVQPEKNVDVWIKTDLADTQSIDAAIKKAKGPFDALLNNAGVPPRDNLQSLILNVNYIGFKYFLDGMLYKLVDGAAIVNTASRAGAMWRENLDEVKALMALKPDQVNEFISQRNITATRAYCLSKEAVIVLTMASTEQLIKRNLRMNSVSPAAVETGILKDFAAAFGEKMVKNVARAGRAGSVEEIASIIVFLASEKSAWIKGQDIIVDGGMSAMAATDIMGL